MRRFKALVCSAFDFEGNLRVDCVRDGTASIQKKNSQQTWENYTTIEHGVYLEDLIKAAWAHPVFGHILALAAGCYVTIWEEQDGEFVLRCTLPDLHVPVTGIAFAPHHKGLRLAVCSQDDYVRVYGCKDSLDCSKWQIEHKIECQGAYSVSFSPSRSYTMLAVGLNAGSTVPFRIFHEDALAWTEWEWMRTNRALSNSQQGTGNVDVSFAPDEYRTFDLLAYVEAQANEPSIVRINQKRPHIGNGFVDPQEYVLTPLTVRNTEAKEEMDEDDMDNDRPRGQVKPAPISSVQWNNIGTILATAGQDVRLWKTLTPSDPEEWRCINVFIHGSHLASN